MDILVEVDILVVEHNQVVVHILVVEHILAVEVDILVVLVDFPVVDSNVDVHVDDHGRVLEIRHEDCDQN